MCRPNRLCALLLLLLPVPANALQLHWSTGADTLTFTVATHCTLLVQAEITDSRLPSEWHLLWVADSLALEFVPRDSVEACLLEQAQVARIEGPASAADSAEHQITAHFCSAGSEAATIGLHVVDLPAGGHGKLKAVALDPTDPDSSQVLESNEVTYNGGADGAYPPDVLHASSVHNSLRLQVTAVGSGLRAANAMSIAAADSSWSLPLTVTARSDGAITGVASVAALLPACEARVGAEGGVVSTATLEADAQPSAPLSPESCALTFTEDILAPPPLSSGHTVAIQPKDLAWARGFIDQTSSRFALHLFYIRHSYYNIPDDDNEKNIGHTWTTDLNNWIPAQPDTAALSTAGRSGRFDELHVWAPSMTRLGPTFHMFYTGVKKDNLGRPHQRIGVATSTDLNTWTQEDNPVLTVPQVPWAMKDPIAYGHTQQLRDPFVMLDPNTGQWLMYFVAVDSLHSPNVADILPKMAVGVAWSNDLRIWHPLDQPFSSTERPTAAGVPTRVESPHVFRRHGQWWMPYTVISVNGSVEGDTVHFETNANASPQDTIVADWTEPIRLRDVTEGPPTELSFWHSTEYLGMQPNVEYLAAWRDNPEGYVDIKGIYPPDPQYAGVDSFALSCPAISAVEDRPGHIAEVRMIVASRRLGAPEAKIRLELPSAMPVRLTVHDIAGRRRTTLLDGDLPSGVSEVVWNGRDDHGVVASGMYFIRLSFASGVRVSKVVLLR